MCVGNVSHLCQINSLVYARVIVANKDMDPELACTSASGKTEGFGELGNGYMFECSLALARMCADLHRCLRLLLWTDFLLFFCLYRLLKPNCEVLQVLGESIAYEIAVGLNGRVWVSSGSPAHTVIVANALANSEFVPKEKVSRIDGVR